MHSEDFKILNNSVDNWLDEKENFELKRNKVFGINPNKYLWIFGILFVYTFFIQETDFSNISNNSILNSSSSTPTAKDYILYEKPDNKSTIILEDNSSIEVNILDKTKYFYKVKLTKNNNEYIGYIIKGKIIQ